MHRKYTALSIGALVLYACAKEPETDPLSRQRDQPAPPVPSGGGPNADPPPIQGGGNESGSPYNWDKYVNTIQPILDNAEGRGCSAAGCHGAATGIGGFKLTAKPAAGSQELKDNFAAVTAKCDLAEPQRSLILIQATTRHGGGTSALVTPEEANTILTWVQEAKATSNGGSPTAPKPTCAPLENFNVGVFRASILPILLGDVDLNNRGQVATTGCAKATCHGSDPPKPFSIKRGNTDEQNLSSFACFVDFANPLNSSVVACPLNQPACKHYPHPGQNVFSGADDANFQRIISYLYASKTAATPLDFAFFVRQVQPIFGDVNLGGAPQRTCSDTGSCHGVNTPTQAPANRSNLPFLANAYNKAGFGFKFSAAANFINVVDATESDLFLYPTNEIANTADHKFATGLPHPGGLDFAPDSAAAQAILTWAKGLQVDAAGFQSNWLVAGDYSAQRVTDLTTLANEATINPAIFDASNAPQFNGGTWDAVFGANRFVDLNASFPRAVTPGRVAYAVSYIVNRTPSDIQATVAVDSANQVLLYVGPTAVQSNGQGVSGLVTLPAYSQTQKATRIMVKVFQAANDRDFGFQLRLLDRNNNPLNVGASGDVLVKLTPEGGI